MTYIRYVQDNMSDNTKLLGLVNALQAFGFYMQGSGWTDDKESHTPIPTPAAELDESDIGTALDGVSDKVIRKNLTGSGIEDVKFALTLNAQTVIRISVKPAEGVTILSSGYKKRTIDNEIYYQFTTPKIGAGKLGTDYTITVETSEGTATVTASAMSYVYAILNSQSFTTEKQLAMTAYYYYYAAAAEYIK